MDYRVLAFCSFLYHVYLYYKWTKRDIMSMTSRTFCPSWLFIIWKAAVSF